MRIFIQKIILLGAIIAAIILALSSFPGSRYHFKNGETESNLFLLPKNTDFDLVILGTSHGKIFSRYGNHTRVEKILGISMENLSTGGGRGIYAAKLFLDYFLSRGNTTKTVVYFIDPWVLYSDKWNEQNDLFSKEPIDLNFLSFIITHHINASTIINYIKTKVSLTWILQSPTKQSEQLAHLETINPESVKKRVDSLYPDGLKEENFQKYKKDLYYIAQISKDRNIHLVFIIPTTLLGDLPGEGNLKEVLADLKKNFAIEYYDFSDVIGDPSLYFDHDHLNTKGVNLFTEKYLKPIVGKR